VVPFEPEKSYLWTLVRDGDMPAKGARAGPLSDQEKETVRAWIAAGASVPPPQAAPPTDSPSTAAPASEPAAPSWTTRLFAWLGKFHLLVIHFPIALLTAAALGELLAAWRGNWVPEPAVRFCVLLGAAGAVAAVALGWLHADLGGHGRAAAGTVTLHRWLGTAAGLWAVATALVSERDSRRGRRSLLGRALLWGGAPVVAVAAHVGGQLVHGGQFFDW
jgi:hypothetical protein